MVKRLGIYGGTFDPVHIGHLMVAEMSRQECGLARVLFIPANHPPHKRNKSISPNNYRLEMIKLAIKSNPYFEVNDMEFKRQGVSYTVDTLRDLRRIYSKQWELWMIIGGDTLLELDTWKDAGEIIKMCNFAIYMRPNFSADRCKAKAESIHRQWDTKIEFIQAPMIEISSTDIRSRVAQGKSIRYMVPYSVEEYIMNKELYLEN